MNNSRSRLPILFACIMFLCVLFIAWYLPAVSERSFRLQDVRKSIETSLGRERKQQYEYDETVASIPEVQAELDRLAPLNDEINQEVKALKDERKRLRQEKKELEALADEAEQQEVTGNE